MIADVVKGDEGAAATMPDMPLFLFDAWYVAGYTTEIDDGALLGRRFLDQPVVLFRDQDGTATAIGDRCPHRFAPLHKGSLANGQVRCGYHGLSFDGTGRCVNNPHGPANATKSLSVPTYEVREVGGLLWIWMGDRDRAAKSQPPAYACLDQTQFFVGTGYLHGAANYELMSDNILDLSHIEFLHPGLGTDAVSRAKVEVAVVDEVLTTSRKMLDEVLPTGLARVYQTAEAKVNRTMAVSWQAPANMLLKVTIEPTAQGETWERGSQTLHLFTPESAHSTHYFYVGCMRRDSGTQELADAFLAALGRAFATEDKPMIDAQQAMIGRHELMTLKPALLSIDKAAVLARRTLARLIAEQPGV